MKTFAILTCLVYSIVGAWGANWSFDMHGDAGLNDYDCGNDDYAFSPVTTRSATHCAYLCSRDAKCKSMFYVPGTSNGACSGCTAIYASTELATLSLNTLQGSVYHVPTFDFIWGTSGYIFIDTEQSFTVGEVCYLHVYTSYPFIDTPQTLTVGEGMCNDLGGYPAAIETEDEQEFLAFRLELINAGVTYIGLRQPGGTETDWIWQGTGQVMSYNGFHANEPNTDDETCVTAAFTKYAWNDVYCSTKLNILCEVAIN